MATRKGGLGKGLEALFVDNETESIAPSTLKITEIEPNREQPRKDFDDTALAELADSIREHGVLQPLLVRPIQGGRYQIIEGERRWRASRMAGLSELPVIIKELDDVSAMEIALIENLQRSDLNIMEEALGLRASGLYLAHNHDSNLAFPSADDWQTTDTLRSILSSVSLELIDHIIFVDGDAVSLNESQRRNSRPVYQLL